jgi:ketosteroid isomerase-like protein
MHITASTVAAAMVLVLLAAPQANAANMASSQLAKAQHDYVAAINSNQPDVLTNAVTSDVVVITPNSPKLIGKVQLRAWARRHFKATHAIWEKTPSDIVVAGDWAFETYEYRVVDTPKTDGPTTIATGSGISVYHRDDDDVWRIARDVSTMREQWTVFETGCEFTRLTMGPC